MPFAYFIWGTADNVSRMLQYTNMLMPDLYTTYYYEAMPDGNIVSFIAVKSALGEYKTHQLQEATGSSGGVKVNDIEEDYWKLMLEYTTGGRVTIDQCRDAEKAAGADGENSEEFRKLLDTESEFFRRKVLSRITIK